MQSEKTEERRQKQARKRRTKVTDELKRGGKIERGEKHWKRKRRWNDYQKEIKIH